MISNIINVVNILGWSAIIVMIVIIFVLNPILYFTKDFSNVVYLAKIVQTFQIIDILLVLLGKSKGSLIGSIAQITGRLIVALIFL